MVMVGEMVHQMEEVVLQIVEEEEIIMRYMITEAIGL